HPVGSVMVGPFEHHDKSRFEIFAISLTPDDNSIVRPRIERAADHFIDIQAMKNADAARMLRDLEIDIAVDLNGLTGERRHAILVPRPAPIQVSYLGYPGTMVAPFIDYIIADPVVIPEENRRFYGEKIAYLPHTYLPFDNSIKVSTEVPSRAA